MMDRLDNHDVFISYKTQDIHIAREIADQLIASGIRVWFDEHQILLINWDEFREVFIDGARRSAFGLAITNNRYLESEYCSLEMDTLLEYVGATRVLEVRWPDEDEPHRRWPELANSPHCTPRDPSEVLSFVQAHTGWDIRPLVRIDESAPRRRVEGRCLKERYSLDVTGWDVINPRGHRSLLGGVAGPVLRYSGGEYPIHVNMRAGRETREARRPHRTASDNEMYDALVAYSRHVGRLGADLRGRHLLFHKDRCQYAATYRMHGYWTRKHSVILPNPSGRTPAEFVLTFGFPGPFEEYCRYARLMDRLVLTLEWG